MYACMLLLYNDAMVMSILHAIAAALIGIKQSFLPH